MVFRSLHRRSGTHGQHIWIELIGPLIWLLEDRIIKIQIKPGHGIRYLHIERRLVHFKKFALIAGFNEIGESIEDTVRREVLEEVGLRVKNLKFYKSQPWTFTDTLLMGFYAQLDGDDTITIQEDGTVIVD